VSLRFVSRCRRNKLQVSVASRREFDSHRLLLHVVCQPGLIKGSKELEITRPILQTRPGTGYDATTGILWTILPTVPILSPVISTSVETQQTLGSQTTWSRCRCEEGCHILPTEGSYLLLLAMIPTLVPRFKCINSNREYVKVWCVTCATHVLYIHQIQNKVLGIRVFVTLSFEMSLYYWAD